MPTTTEIDFADLHQMLTNTRDVTEAAAILAERQASELADSLEGPDVTHALGSPAWPARSRPCAARSASASRTCGSRAS